MNQSGKALFNGKGSNNGRTPLNDRKTRLYNSRAIKAQTTESAYDKQESILNVPQFLDARKFEINAFEESQLKSKNAMATRCFQALPRAMRRRAASHHVSRIPKRLRRKAIREMNGANGPPQKRLPRGRQFFKLMQKYRVLKAASKLRQDRQEFNPTLKHGNVRKYIRSITRELYTLRKNDHQKRFLLNNSAGAVDRAFALGTALGGGGGSGSGGGSDGVGFGFGGSGEKGGFTGVDPAMAAAGKLATPSLGGLKYRSRQKEFVWVPTHVWHAKRFKMCKQNGFQIPFTPTQKCFKMMNRQNRYKSVCFDTSYYATMVVSTTVAATSTTTTTTAASPSTAQGLGSKLDDVTFSKILQSLLNRNGPIPKSIIQGKKSYVGWIYWNGKRIAPGLVFVNRMFGQLLIRIPNETYTFFFEQFNKAIAHDEIKARTVDCRYSIGGIDLSGPSGLRSLSKVFHMKNTSQEMSNIWSSLSSLSDNSLIPVGTTLSFSIYDPRLWKRPTKLPIRNSVESIYNVLMNLNAGLTIDHTTANSLMTSQGRQDSYKDQLTIKELGKIFRYNTDFSKVLHSTIPVILIKTEPQRWTVLCPWYWVLPIWLQLVKVLDVKPGGLKQMQQFSFERKQPVFPRDYLWLPEGWKYNNIAGDLANASDSRKPKNVVKLQDSENQFSQAFNAYKADWFTLRNLLFLLKYRKQIMSPDGVIDNPLDDPERKLETIDDVIAMTNFLKKEQELCPESIPINIYGGKKKKDEIGHEKLLFDGMDHVESIPKIILTSLPVVQVCVQVTRDGVIEDNARLYAVPNSSDVNAIGFVTTGGMNLNVGKCTGNGCIIAIEKYMNKSVKTIYVRNPGKSSIYACTYELVDV